jgi:magnesium-transporting ATPase (P-type)
VKAMKKSKMKKVPAGEKAAMKSKTNMNKYALGFGLSLVVTNLLNAVILIVKEVSASVMDVMKAVLGHHWMTHAVLLLFVFVVLGAFFSIYEVGAKWDSRKMMFYIIGSVIISVVIITVFFLPYLIA